MSSDLGPHEGSSLPHVGRSSDRCVGFDMVGAQTPGSRGRGIGRYVDGFVGAFVRGGFASRTVLYFHDDLPLDPHWREGGAEIRLCGPFAERRARLERLVDENPDRLDALVVTSPLLEPLGKPESGLPSARAGGLVLASIVYDLIPLLFPEEYLGDPRQARDYHERLRVLAEYDALLAISRATRDDIVRLLGVPARRVLTIGCGADPSWFTPGEANAAVLDSLGVRRPFILSVAATQVRKNSERLMEAVGRVSGPRPLQLVLCHEVSPGERELLGTLAGRYGIADRLAVTGRVDDETLRNLYRGCAALALPSRYEGFGLPLLEAMRCGAPVVGGHNSAQPEVVGPGGHLVEPDDVSGLAAILERLAFDEAERSRSRARGLLHSAAFRWESCAARCDEALRETVKRRPARRRSRSRRLRVGMFSPLPPAASGVADHAAELVERLQEDVDIDVFHDRRERPIATAAHGRLGVYDERLFAAIDRAQPYDVLLHEMGNHLHHEFVYRSVLRHGGLVFLHEINLGGLQEGLAAGEGAAPDYLAKELAFDQPDQWEEIVRSLPELARGPGGLGRALGERGAYLSRRVVQAAGRVLVSDALTLERLNEVYPETIAKTATVPLGATASPRPRWEKAALRREHGLPEQAFVFGVFGVVSSTKYHLEIVDAFRSLAAEDPSALLLYVGRGPDAREVGERARQISIGAQVRLIEDPPGRRFRDLVHVVDVGVNVRRPPTNWESSASLLHLLAGGIPTVTTAVDAFRGVPARAVERIKEGLEPVVAIERAMRRLRDSEARRHRLREEALRHVSTHHDWAVVARACLGQLQEVTDHGLGRRGGSSAS